MPESRELQTLRSMAWERAKGELNSMLHTFYSQLEEDQRYNDFDLALSKFINLVEGNGWQE